MRVVFRFGVYIVTESVMGLWWFRWIVFSFSCIGLATSFTSSKSYCIKSFLFSYQIVLLWILQMLYQITSKSFLFASDSTHEYGDEMPTHETACCITITFWETRKKVLVRGFRLPLVPCELPSHGEPLWFSAGPFLMRIE